MWCSWCGQRVRFLSTVPGGAAHEVSSYVMGGDGHRIAPVDHEPPLWRAAREITADYHGAFTIDATFGFLRADWSPGVLPEGATRAHYEAPTADELRLKLDQAVAGTEWERQQESAGDAGGRR